jgi:hypothetical protein
MTAGEVGCSEILNLTVRYVRKRFLRGLKVAVRELACSPRGASLVIESTKKTLMNERTSKVQSRSLQRL